MDQLFEKMTNFHYSFRNRITKLRLLMNDKNIDGLLIIISYDSLNSALIHRLTKWLVFGYSSLITLEEKSIPPEFNETFILLTKANLYIFSLRSTSTYFYEITSKVSNVEMYITTKDEEGDGEKLEAIKIAKFIQWTYQVKTIGIPLLYEERHNALAIEKWPLVSVTGLDILKEGFFTMNHDIVDIGKELDVIYHQIDLYACVNFLIPKADMIEATIADFYAYFERDPINKRLERSEENINQNQYLELIRLDYKKKLDSTFAFLNNLPSPRLLFGVNSNKDDTSTESLYKFPFDFNFPGYHITYENFDPITGIRIGRTIFLYTLQKTFLDLNKETSMYEFTPTAAYRESIYLFNLYFKLVSFSRDKQFDIILGKLSIDDARKSLQESLNTFIRDNYNTDVFDCLITSDNVVIQKEEYILLSKAPIGKQNKVILIRFEVRELYSAISRRSIGSLLFADSFLYCYSQLFNLTTDILPFKFIMSSYQHYKPIEYDPMQILRSASTVKLKDIDYKGLSFYQPKYNIPYLFQDSSEVALDPNQLFIFYSGKIIVYDDYILFTDDSVGKIIISFDNIEGFYFYEELDYTVFLIKTIDGDSLPLSDIIKKEMLIYLRGNTERLRIYGRDIIDFIKKSKIASKAKLMSNDMLFEYELAIKAINTHEYDQLNHVSNNFNLTTMIDVLDAMYEYEYLLYTNDKFYSYPEYKKIKESAFQLLTDDNNDNEEIITTTKPIPTIKSNKKKIMFTFSTDPITSKDFCDKLIELAKTFRLEPKVYMPLFNLFAIEAGKDNMTDYYINVLKEIASNSNRNVNSDNSIHIICIYHSCSILDFLYKLTTHPQMKQFYNEYKILNISYIVNLNNYKANKNKDPLFKDLYYEDIINYTFVDEGYLFQTTIDKYSKILLLSNSKTKIYNKRSFLYNSKEMGEIFSIEHINKRILQFYLTYYYKNPSLIANPYQTIFIHFKYVCKKDLLNKFLQRYINEPLKEIFNLASAFPSESNEQIPKMTNDIEYQQYLKILVRRCKILQTDPVACNVYGIAKVLNDNSNLEYCYINANYKEVNLMSNKEEEKDNIGLLILGRNLLNEQLKEFYSKMLQLLCGEFPKKRKYRTKEEITKEERQNLNVINCNRPLPDGWYFQGAIFIDSNEEGHSEHPNIENFIDEYVELNNKAIDEHNQRIQEEIDKYLI